MIEKIENETLCIIAETGEEKYLVPVYDESITEGLRIFEKYAGGKFIAWKDMTSGKLYTPRTEAYPKPELPYDLFGVECGQGWHKLLEPVLDYINNWNKENPEAPIIIEQIKEKFARLEIYVEHSTPELNKLIEEAKERAYKTCEFCGDTTDVGMYMTIGHWYTTLCRKCAIEKSTKARYFAGKWKSYNDNNTYIVEKGNIKVSE